MQRDKWCDGARDERAILRALLKMQMAQAAVEAFGDELTYPRIGAMIGMSVANHRLTTLVARAPRSFERLRHSGLCTHVSLTPKGTALALSFAGKLN